MERRSEDEENVKDWDVRDGGGRVEEKMEEWVCSLPTDLITSNRKHCMVYAVHY